MEETLCCKEADTQAYTLVILARKISMYLSILV
jgi:hypothetical protein